ncbi:Nn.00g048910.m01.CDS01 [Neocucurbitaria sp. VM-36]
MARAGHSGTVVGSAVVVREKYYWPDLQLNIWTIVMLATAGTILGVNAQFMGIQDRMDLGTPWIMPYGVTVGALAIIFIIIEIVYIAQRKLLPGTMMLLSFILLVLFIAGIIGTAIQLFAGPNINNQCNTYVFGDDSSGANLNTLAFLQQRNICQCWQAVFAFWIVGSVFLVWMMVMASQVNSNQYAS